MICLQDGAKHAPIDAGTTRPAVIPAPRRAMGQAWRTLRNSRNRPSSEPARLFRPVRRAPSEPDVMGYVCTACSIYWPMNCETALRPGLPVSSAPLRMYGIILLLHSDCNWIYPHLGFGSGFANAMAQTCLLQIVLLETSSPNSFIQW